MTKTENTQAALYLAYDAARADARVAYTASVSLSQLALRVPESTPEGVALRDAAKASLLAYELLSLISKDARKALEKDRAEGN